MVINFFVTYLRGGGGGAVKISRETRGGGRKILLTQMKMYPTPT